MEVREKSSGKVPPSPHGAAPIRGTADGWRRIAAVTEHHLFRFLSATDTLRFPPNRPPCAFRFCLRDQTSVHRHRLPRMRRRLPVVHRGARPRRVLRCVLRRRRYGGRAHLGLTCAGCYWLAQR
jgi:hypothetical protein